MRICWRTAVSRLRAAVAAGAVSPAAPLGRLSGRALTASVLATTAPCVPERGVPAVLIFRPRRLATPLVAALLAMALAGCSSGQATITPGTPSTSPSAVPTSRPTPAPTPPPTVTPTPRPTGFQEQADGTVTWVTDTGEVKQVEPFNGLAPQLKDGKVVYLDAKGEAAEFKSNLVMGGNQTGVIIARGDIVATLTKKAHGAGQFKFALPVDLSKIASGTTTTVDADDEGPAGLSEIAITIPQEADLVEFDPYNTGRYITVERATGVNYEINDKSLRLLPTDKVQPGKELLYTNILSTDNHLRTIKDIHTETLSVGAVLNAVSPGKTSIACYTLDLGSATLTSGNILTASDGTTPLAILANE